MNDNAETIELAFVIRPQPQREPNIADCPYAVGNRLIGREIISVRVGRQADFIWIVEISGEVTI